MRSVVAQAAGVRFLLVLVFAAAVCAVPWRVTAATITVISLDGPSSGFNDPSPVSPIGGNAGMTLGEQRRIAFEYAAGIWADLLNSGVEIRVQGSFANLPCSGGGAVLGSAGPNSVFRDFAGAPQPATWYASALAKSLAGVDLNPATDDMSAEFNARIDRGCIPGISGWYYGLDGNPPSGTIHFIPVLLHEMAHGFGFLTLVDLSTGGRLLGFDDAYSLFLEDHTTGKLYPEMTNVERVAASTNTGNLHWVGANVVAASGILSAGRESLSGHVEMHAPSVASPGSSVSHFSTSLSPNELMEPFLTADPMMDLTIELMKDTGWHICGDGIVDPLEECDDGNRQDGDGCSASCRVEECFACTGEPSNCAPLDDNEPCDDGNDCTGPGTCQAGVCSGPPADGVPCDDGNPCTFDDVCNAGACVSTATPLDGCFTSLTGNLTIRERNPKTRDALTWRWMRGSPSELGDPVHGGTEYRLCIYAGDQAQYSGELPAGEHWTELRRNRGFRYRDRFAQADGINAVMLRRAAPGRTNAAIVVRGKGVRLDLAAPLDHQPPIVVQWSNGDACWESTFSASDIRRHTDELLRANHRQ